MKVLVADDEEDARLLLSTMLEAKGYVVETAITGVQALELARHSLPDLIISDILMPEMDGYALCRAIKTDKKLSAIPFIFYTATYVDPRDEQLAMALGASRFILKAMEPQEFLKVVEEVLTEYKQHKLPVPKQPQEDEETLKRMHEECLARQLDSKMQELECERQALQVTQSSLLAAQRIAHLGNWDWDISANTLYWSDETYRIFGFQLQEFTVTYKMFMEVVHPDDRELVTQAVNEAIIGEKPYSIGHRIVRPDGEERFVQEQGEVTFDEAGNPIHMVGTVHDITEQRAAEKLTARLGNILDHSSNEIYVFDAKFLHFTQVNQGARTNLGYTMEELAQLTPLDLKPEFTLESFANLIEPLRSGEQEQIIFETVHRRKDGSLYPVEVRLQLSRQESPPVFVSIILDITQRKEIEEHLTYLAYHDSLTGLPNRPMLRDRLEQAIIEAGRHDRAVGVLFLDLDSFKTINDTLGHDVGDHFLQAVAERMRGAVREGDTVARLGGDEFVFVLTDMAHAEDAARVAETILNSFTLPFQTVAHEAYITASIGITVFPDDGDTGDKLLKNGDTAMYHAKQLGRNSYRFYSTQMTAQAFEHMKLDNALHRALDREEFLLYYQPQVNAANRQIIGVEALVRWQHPDLGLVSPEKFIPIAEETGLIVPLGEWVLRTACIELKSWREAGIKPLHIAVNLSAKQFREWRLIEVIEQFLRENCLESRFLELELTESVIMQDPEAAVKMLHRLSESGIRISIDDFGTGYSSLSLLRQFPIHNLKIDQSFVRDITIDTDDAAIVTTIIAMAHSLNLGVIAEGVETDQQLKFLRRNGCNVMQGYLFYKPLPGQELAALLHNQHSGGAPH